MRYSVLMSVYHRVHPEHLRQSMESMLAQTAPPDDFVLVCDGALTPELDAVIAGQVRAHPGLFQVVRLPRNVGAGGAANAGLRQCRSDLVAKMDADDLAPPDRCERQLEAFRLCPGLDIVGGQLEEFSRAGEIVAVRRVPLTHEEIVAYARRRMPFNNQTVMFRRAAVWEAGGYRPHRRCEDYDLFTRMLLRGSRARNLPDVLGYFRLDDAAYGRRGSLANLAGFTRVRWELYRRGFSTLGDFLVPFGGQLLLTAMPTGLKNWFYVRYLRKTANT